MRGTCILSTIPVRREPDSTSEITTMLLFGDTFSVSEQENGWSYIKNDFDGYTGWISSRQVEKLHREPKRSTPCAGFPFLRASSKNGPVFILSGSSIPDLEGSSFTINDETYELDLPNVSYKPSDIIYVAKQYLNM